MWSLMTLPPFGPLFLCTMINSVPIVSLRIILINILSSETCKFDFEAGIHDWEKTGSAFNNQPTYGDNSTARNRDQHANQQGRWWIGGAEDRPSISVTAGKMQGDAPKGTLTSPYFRIIGGHISFLIGGGCDIKTVRAELIVGNKVRSLMLKSTVRFKFLLSLTKDRYTVDSNMLKRHFLG